MPFAEYLGIKSHYSSTELRLVLPPNGTPASLWHKRNGPPEDPNQEHFLMGRALHAHSIEGRQDYRVAPAEYPSDGKMKPWHMGAQYCKDWNLKHADKDILTAKQHAEVMKWASAIKCDKEAQDYLAVPGRSEVSGFVVDPETQIPMRIRMDWLPDAVNSSRPALGDIKTAKTVSPVGFIKACINNGYRCQGATYLHVYNLIAKEHGWPERHDWFFVAVLKSEPYFVKVYGLNQIDLEYGRQEMRAALRIIRSCQDSGKWPAYPSEKPGLQMLEFPKYAYNQDLSAYLGEE